MTSLGVIAHRDKELGDGLTALRERLERAGHAEVARREVDKSKHAPKHMRKLLEVGVDRVLVWGGDGTVRRCVDAMVDADADVDIVNLPAGTANLLARGLGVPIDLDGAVDVALRGNTRRIDLGVVNGERFAMMAGAGFDALLIRDADDDKDRIGRLAYVRAGARHLTTDGVDVTIDVDGRRWYEGPTASVLIGNLGQIVGGLTVFPDAEPDDGKLDVGIVTIQGRLDWARVLLRAAVGRVDTSPLVEITQGRDIDVRLGSKTTWELDGGDRSETRRLDVSVLPRRLSVCVPAP